ncbi:hypothetical protein [Agromyces sp. LHK192]|uniref:hypothetical protein n=1 Tax=Agromyces sp. LHK192 TaxID=2498704 RepID=UPI000FDB9A38|nr:hypothetical protein [Agromyces sp. LHK192]
MAERVCEVCGSTNDAAAQFCRSCDTYLGWDSGASTLDGEPLTGLVPTVVDAVPTTQVPVQVEAPVQGGSPTAAAATAGAPAATAAAQETAAHSAAAAAPATTEAPATAESPATADAPDSIAAKASATAPPESSVPSTKPAQTQPAPTQPAPTQPGPSVPDASPAPPSAAAPARIEAPDASLEVTEAMVAPGAAATVVLKLANPSSIVDGYDVTPVAAPDWVDVTVGDTHLMPGQEGAVPITITLREGVLVLAQRIALTLRISSRAEPERAAEVTLQLTVPPLGPSATLEVRPSLIRLEDHAAGEFTVRLDNRAANFPQTVRLTATDAEEVVRFAFAPAVVSVPAGQVVELQVAFTAPEPEPGRELSRQVTVGAGNDAGRSAVTLTLVQRTTAEAVDAPVRVRIEPSTLELERGNIGDFDVIVDHRGGVHEVTLTLAGRDPAQAIGFAFSSEQVVLEPGSVQRVRGRLSAPLPPRGETERHPFSVVASDGVRDVEATGVVELSSPPEPILTAAIRVEPPSQLIVNERQATFQVVIDNQRGLDPLAVRLDGASEDGAARLTFFPAELSAPPGGVVAARLVVDAPRPEAKESVLRRIRVSASDGVRSIETDATLTQAATDRRPVVSRILVIIGGLLVIIGAFMEWFAGFDAFLPSAQLIAELARSGVDVTNLSLLEPAVRVLVLVLAALMLLGMIGTSGRLTRFSAVVIVLVTLGLLLFLAVAAFVPPLGLGLVLIWLGAVLGFVGGVLAKRRD